MQSYNGRDSFLQCASRVAVQHRCAAGLAAGAGKVWVKKPAASS